MIKVYFNQQPYIEREIGYPSNRLHILLLRIQYLAFLL